MNTQQIVLDVKQIKPEALNIFYAHILKQCELAKQNTEIYQEYLEQKKKQEKQEGNKKNLCR